VGVQPAQLGFVFRATLAEQLHHLRFLARCLQEEMTKGRAVQRVQLVRCCATLRGYRWADEVQLHDSGHDRFMGDHRGVLADGDRAAKRGLVGFITCRLDTFRGQRAAAEKVFQLVPFEGFGVRFVFAVTVGLQEHNGHA